LAQCTAATGFSAGDTAKEKKMAEKNPEKRDELRLEDAHPHHDQHLCHIVNIRNMKSAAKLSKDAQYMCYLCGRAAKSDKNLCDPINL
jgi:hypothetical protein